MPSFKYLHSVGYGVAALTGLGIIWIGSRFLLDPVGMAKTFGVPDPPSTPNPFLLVKGVRDIGSGVVLLALLFTGQRRGVAVALLAASTMPAGDALIVLGYGGPASVALGVHGATAVTMVLGGAALLSPVSRRSRDQKKTSGS